MKRLFNYLTILFILLLPTSAFAPPTGGPIGGGGSGGGIAASIVTDTTNFDGALTAADNTVQAALDTLDDAAAGVGTVDTEWDTMAEINAASTDTDAVLDTDIGGTVQAYDVDLDTLATPTNWRIFYSNDAATITELALGIDGTFLESNGVAAAPAFRVLTDADIPDDITITGSTTGTSAYTTRETSVLSFTNAETQTAFSEANMLANGTINNQGAGEETDIILTAVSYSIKFEVEISEPFLIELCPPAGELFTLDGTALDVNDCIDSSAVVGDCFMVKRRQIADASWQYFAYTIQGVHVDTGPEDD